MRPSRCTRVHECALALISKQSRWRARGQSDKQASAHEHTHLPNLGHRLHPFQHLRQQAHLQHSKPVSRIKARPRAKKKTHVTDDDVSAIQKRRFFASHDEELASIRVGPCHSEHSVRTLAKSWPHPTSISLPPSISLSLSFSPSISQHLRSNI